MVGPSREGINGAQSYNYTVIRRRINDYDKRAGVALVPGVELEVRRQQTRVHFVCTDRNEVQGRAFPMVRKKHVHAPTLPLGLKCK